MKAIYLIFISLLFSCQSFAQNDTTKTSLGITPKIDIAWPIIGTIVHKTEYSFSIEKEISSHGSVELTLQHSYLFNSAINSANNEQYITHIIDALWQVIPEYRYYIGKSKRHSGLYASVYPDMEFLNKTTLNTYPIDNTAISNSLSLATGMAAGVKVYIVKKIVVDLTIGDCFGIFIPSPSISPSYLQYFRFSLDIGYLF